ncbi:ABC transporter substrate-binding protein [Blastococcus saxobsidens]|nr:ABC transporter substrate-binding protein [Blastococcus saxobsidens]
MKAASKVVTAVVGVALTASACGGSSGSGGSSASSEACDGPPDSVTIAVGSGIAYAPLTIMMHEGILEDEFPDTEFVWQEGVSGGAATRDGMLGGQIQVGVAGIAPFLVGVDRGVEWKVLGSMSQLGIDLVAIDPAIQSLEDLDASGRPISLPSPDSGQAIALAALGEEQLGDATAFDDQLASMGHPDAYQALLSGTTGAAFIGPPFQYRLIADSGARTLASASDVFGEMTYSAIVLTQDFYDCYEPFSQAVFEALEETLTMLRERPAEAAEILSEAEGGAVTAEQYEKWIADAAEDWTVEPAGYEQNAEFMESIGLISEVPDIDSLMLPTVSAGS